MKSLPNKIFNSLLDEKIASFIRGFSDTAKQTFLDNSGKLIHPGEYGRYRESCCKDFLQYFIPRRLDIEEGFIINAQDEVSTECDIVIYDKNNTPLIQSKELQKFYPVETVAAVGEIKSTLTKKQLKDALEKLSRVKALRKGDLTSGFLNRDNSDSYDPTRNPKDTLFTFLICEKFDFDQKDLAVTLNNIYSKGVAPNHRHNLLLSLKDGLATYYSEQEGGPHLSIPYPIFNSAPVKTVFTESTPENDHIKTFASYMFMGASGTALIQPDIISYLMSKYANCHYAI